MLFSISCGKACGHARVLKFVEIELLEVVVVALFNKLVKVASLFLGWAASSAHASHKATYLAHFKYLVLFLWCNIFH